jgi:hypothetical protein
MTTPLIRGTTINPLKQATQVNNTSRFSFYLKENTPLLHYKNQLVDAV